MNKQNKTGDTPLFALIFNIDSNSVFFPVWKKRVLLKLEDSEEKMRIIILMNHQKVD